VRPLLRAAIAAGITLGSIPVAATTVAPRDLSDMAMASDLGVRGTIQALRTFREPSGRILTEAVVEVREAMQGQAPDTVAVTWPGGELDGQGQRVPGTPRVRTGQEVVLFLARPGPDSLVARYLPVSLAAGVLEVRRLPDRSLLVRDLQGLHSPDGLGLPPLPDTLEELLECLRSLRGEAGP